MEKNIKGQSIKLTNLFNEFFNSEKSAGLILLFCSAVSIMLANSFWATVIYIFGTQMFF